MKVVVLFVAALALTGCGGGSSPSQHPLAGSRAIGIGYDVPDGISGDLEVLVAVDGRFSGQASFFLEGEDWRGLATGQIAPAGAIEFAVIPSRRSSLAAATAQLTGHGQVKPTIDPTYRQPYYAGKVDLTFSDATGATLRSSSMLITIWPSAEARTRFRASR